MKHIYLIKDKIERGLMAIKCKQMSGEGHLIAVMLTMAVVCALGIYFKTEISDWFKTNFSTFKSSTTSIFSNL